CRQPSAGRGAAAADLGGGAGPGHPAAPPGGALPAPLPARAFRSHRRRPRGGVVMDTLAGTGGLVRLILRRDRVLLPLWVLGWPSSRSATCPPSPTSTPRPRHASSTPTTRDSPPSTVACPAPASVSSSPGDWGSSPSWSRCLACSPSS